MALFVVLMISGAVSNAQDSGSVAISRRTPEMYIETFREAAILDMKNSGVPASITLAQGMYESDYGNSPLALEANNHFGIKCHKEWNGSTYYQDDDAPNECFRKYNSVFDSYADHSDFLRSRDRYRFLFDLEITDYKGWSHGLKKAGYATNPHYAHKLIELIERYQLNLYDNPDVSVPLAVKSGPKSTVKDVSQKEDIATAPPKKRKIELNWLKKQGKSKEAESEINSARKPDESVPVKSQTGRKADATVTVSADCINGVPFVKAGEGDTWSKIARDNDVELWQILQFNDADKNDDLKSGQVVFTHPKKNKGESFTHIVAEGETMHQISQQYAVKLSRLYRMNEIEYGEQPAPGTKVYLQRAMLLGVVL